ncbi:unnamed protein product [Cuscuta epithymum]|uniref:Aminotransferase-like plant mobile domain-containing protein n=1 Tax=Cuscuta epithymum TaxID=186058 RepID=A0AAV0FJT3_9ASTE|nr:unnamed protein product [Cuscuta epithymum]
MADLIMEEREELMVSHAGGKPALRTAHFLKPSTNSRVFSLPQQTAAAGVREPPPKFRFHGWSNKPLKDWEKWVESMCALHQPIWKKAGIHEAIMNSTSRIHRSDELIVALARNWNPETNTFWFPWGEATLTLEDMIVLGGFSVLGGCVDPDFSPVKDRKLEDTKQKLLKARIELNKSAAKKVTQTNWICKFMNNSEYCEIEHEAFLVLWLERYVFPYSPRDTIGTKLLDMAIRLGRGEKMALAPAVLAIIYKNLTFMKNALLALDRTKKSAISAPFRLVQVWVWERFPALNPNHGISAGHERSRFARWDDVKMSVKKNLEFVREDFIWRPYMFWARNSLLYKEDEEEERWILVGSGDEEVHEFVRCLRVSELVGLEGCIEQYLPHRVAMQFGMDQDVPAFVARANESPGVAWDCYTRPVLDMKLWVPSRRSFQSGVTTHYLRSWGLKESMGTKKVGSGVKRKKEGCQRSRTESDENAPPPTSLDDEDHDDEISLAELLMKREKLKEKAKHHTPGKTGVHGEKQPEILGLCTRYRCNESSGRERSEEHVEMPMVQEKGLLEDKSVSISFKKDKGRGGGCTSTPAAASVRIAGEGGVPSPQSPPWRTLEAKIMNLEKLVALMKRKN